MPSHPPTSVLVLARLAACALGLLTAGFVVVGSSRTALPPAPEPATTPDPIPARIASVAISDPPATGPESTARIGSRALAAADGGR